MSAPWYALQKTYKYLFLLSFLLFVLALPPIGLNLFACVFLLPLFLILSTSLTYADSFKLGAGLGSLIGAYVFLGTFVYIPTYYFAVIACLAVFFGLCTLITYVLLQKINILKAIVIGCVWVSGELVLEYIHLPFSLAVPLADNSVLVQLAYFGGQYLLTWACVFFQIVLLVLFRHFQKRHITAAYPYIAGMIVLLLLITAANHIDRQEHQTEPFKAAVLQTSVKPAVGHHYSADGNLEKILQSLYALDAKTRMQNYQLVVWPEMSFVGLYAQNNMFQPNPEADVVINTVFRNTHGERYNSVFLQKKNQKALHLLRHKEVLVPGVETEAYFASGENQLSESRYLPLICFESAFPGLTKKHINESVGVLTISTSDAFAGPAFQYLAHHEFAKLRAVEANRFVVRAANGGISAIIDPYGNTLSEAVPFRDELITAEISSRTTLSFFHRWYKAWIGFFIGMSLYAFFQFVIQLRHKKQEQDHTGIKVENIKWASMSLGIVCIMLFAQHKVSQNIYLAANQTDVSVKQTYQTGEALPVYTASKTPLEFSLAGALSFVLREYGILTHADYMLQIDDLETYLGQFNLRLLYADLETAFPASTPFIVQNRSSEYQVILGFNDETVTVFSPVKGEIVELPKTLYVESLENEYLLLDFIPTSD